MFIEYSRDAISHSSAGELEQSLLYACNAMRSGDHVVCTETRDLACKIIRASKKTNHCIASCFDALKEHFSEIASVKLYVNSFIRIIPGNALPSVRLIRGQHEIRIGIALTTKSEFWYKTCFIAENLDDISGYNLIYQACYPDGPSLKSDNNLGGGTTTCKIVEQKAREGRFVLCILDSDRHSPSDKIGDTANKVLDLSIPELCNVVITESQEIENLFLSKKILECIRNNNLTQRDIDILSQIDNAEKTYPNARFYYDIKSGYRYKDVVNNTYLDGCFAPNKINCKLFTSNENCKCKECTCVIIQGFGKKFFSEEILNSESIKNNLVAIYSELPDFMKREWERLAIATLSWCCAYRLNVLGV